jgi:Fe-S-cluster-containing hydrogenase component 2
MINRHNELKNILREGRYFKVVCGAGNEDSEEVRRLTLVYTLAGAVGIDVSANVVVVEAAMKGIDKAYDLTALVGKEIKTRPFITVSVGLKGDPHVRKARIDAEKCSQCGLCLDACEQDAINEDFNVVDIRCVGCGKCAEVCQFEAVTFYTRKVDFNEILPRCLDAGAENIELHAIIDDDDSVMSDWRVIDGLVQNNFVSMCLDRSQLSDNHLVSRINAVYEISGERTIIQADGAPMSGGSNDFNTTLQAVAIADIIRKSKIPVMILASGGTNSKTGELTRMCNVSLNGVSIGTFARKIVRDLITSEDFETNQSLIKNAVAIAEKLVQDHLKVIQR